MNPGVPGKDMWMENFDSEKTNITNYRICPICQIIMNINENTEHCPDCNVCIEGLDHHCPWTSKCIGKKNKYAFNTFVWSTLFLIVYLIFALFSFSLTQKKK